MPRPCRFAPPAPPPPSAVCRAGTAHTAIPQDTSPDVVYLFAVSQDTPVSISTCGSDYDTLLILTTDPDDSSAYVVSDDDPHCAFGSATATCSKVDATLLAGATYYVIVDGYMGAAGRYVLDIDGTGHVVQ